MSTNVPPGEKWQEMARTVVELAERRLLEHPEALAYLQGRGLTENTIRRGRLGYIPHDAFDDDVARWGLSKEEAKAVWLPRGWTIPWMVGDLIWSVKIRRPNEDTEQAKSWNQNHSGGERKIDAKYLSIRRDGQAEGLSLYNADALSGHADVILVEGEFDALLLDQELGGVVPAATLASASRGIDSAALLHLIQMRRIWTSYDSDAAGDEGAKRLNAKSLRIRRLKWPDNGIKDVTDLWKAGYDLVTWALSQVGPIWTPERVKWCEWWLERLKDDPQPQRQRIVAFLRREAAQLGVEHEPVADSPVPAMRMVSPVAIAAASKRSGVLPREDIVPDAETPCPPAKCWACGKERFWLRPSPSGADWLCCACQPSPTGQPRLLSIRGVIQPEQPGMV
ncbi:MAG: toprim domain-containing protein [Anaerolineales bacterium]